MWPPPDRSCSHVTEMRLATNHYFGGLTVSYTHPLLIEHGEEDRSAAAAEEGGGGGGGRSTGRGTR